MRIGLYARVSTHDQHTLPLQIEEMQKYVSHRQWTTTLQIEEIKSGAKDRPKRDLLIQAARKRNIDTILVWRLNRGRYASDLIITPQELSDLVGFISLKEALDLTTITGRTMAGLLSIFSQFERDILRERVKAGISDARKQGKLRGRPLSASHKTTLVKQLYEQGISKVEIARQLCIGRTSVRRFLQEAQFL